MFCGPVAIPYINNTPYSVHLSRTNVPGFQKNIKKIKKILDKAESACYNEVSEKEAEFP